MKAGGSGRLTARFLAIWFRNWTVYKRTWTIDFLPPVLEPIFYVAAFGIGFRVLVAGITYHGQEMSYVRFIAPALIAVGIMNSSFFETTYASFVRMYYQKTFDAIMSAPVSVEEVITGEIAWGASRSTITCAVMLTVLSLFGLMSWPQSILILPVALLGGLAFASIGMVFTGLVPNINLFNLPTFLLITPMFLFSGTFFSLDSLPVWAQRTALFFPLTHLVSLCRGISCGVLTTGEAVQSVAYLALFTAVFFPLALFVMLRRLIK